MTPFSTVLHLSFFAVVNFFAVPRSSSAIPVCPVMTMQLYPPLRAAGPVIRRDSIDNEKRLMLLEGDHLFSWHSDPWRRNTSFYSEMQHSEKSRVDAGILTTYTSSTT
ncbi:unnamed protein product [Gongylonema pulchrum]|uniref:Secreted protein n=1 Tax=Gongylonema pulchrum TaxID=637853 RepID=A0A183EV77_9BILA|nr:unnamed protein product [Gongylonema pulchrum]